MRPLFRNKESSLGREICTLQSTTAKPASAAPKPTAAVWIAAAACDEEEEEEATAAADAPEELEVVVLVAALEEEPEVAVAVVLAGVPELVVALSAEPEEADLFQKSVLHYRTAMPIVTHPAAVDAQVAVCGRVVTPAPAQILSAKAIVSVSSSC